MDLFTRVNEILKTLPELSTCNVTRSTLLNSSPVTQIVQITSLITSKIRRLSSSILGISLLTIEWSVLIKILFGNGKCTIVQTQYSTIRCSSQIKIIVVRAITNINLRRSSTTNVIVTWVQAISSIFSELFNKHKTISLQTSIRKTHFTAFVTKSLSKHHKHETILTNITCTNSTYRNELNR